MDSPSAISYHRRRNFRKGNVEKGEAEDARTRLELVPTLPSSSRSSWRVPAFEIICTFRLQTLNKITANHNFAVDAIFVKGGSMVRATFFKEEFV